MFTLLAALLFAAIYFTSPPKRYPTSTQQFSFDEFRRRHDLRLTKGSPSGTINKATESQSCNVIPFKPRESKSEKS